MHPVADLQNVLLWQVAVIGRPRGGRDRRDPSMMKTKRSTFAGLCATAGAALMAVSVNAPAMASTAAEGVAGASTVVSSTTTTSDECVAAVTAAIVAGDGRTSLDVCTSTVTLSTSPAQLVTAADLAQARSSMSATDFRGLTASLAAGSVTKKDYSQSIDNITDRQTQSGVFYFDGSRAWVTGSYRGYTGTHNCNVSYAVGYVVEEKACSESGSSSQRDLYMKWHFSVIPSGGAVNWDEDHTMHVNSAGRIWQ
jgi:hypothetical protein